MHCLTKVILRTAQLKTVRQYEYKGHGSVYKSMVKMHADKDIYISYDSTNMNCVAGNLELAEYGHAKDNPDLPQVNMSLGYNQTGNKPLFYSLYPGSIIDNTECEKNGRTSEIL